MKIQIEHVIGRFIYWIIIYLFRCLSKIRYNNFRYKY